MLIVDGALNWCSFEDQIRFVKLWKSKKTATSISKEMNWSVHRVYKAKTILGLKNKLDPKHPYREMQTKSFKKLYYKGYGLKRIAEVHNVSHNVVWKRLKEHKVTIRGIHDKRNPLYTYYGSKKKNLSANNLTRLIVSKYQNSLLSIDQISKDLKVSRKTIQKRILASNLKIRRPVPPRNVKCCDFCGDLITNPRGFGTVKEQRFCSGKNCRTNFVLMKKGFNWAKKKHEFHLSERMLASVHD